VVGCTQTNILPSIVDGVTTSVAFVVLHMQVPEMKCATVADAFVNCRGSKFLKGWMEFLEENADLRYPDPSELQDHGMK